MAKINEFIDIAARKNILECTNKDLFTSGSIRVNKIRLSLDPWWDNLSKWYCFKIKGKTCYADEVQEIGGEIIVTIPEAIFAKENEGNTCFFGIYGSEGAEPDKALSTPWYTLGKVEEGVYASNSLIAESDSLLAVIDEKIKTVNKIAAHTVKTELDDNYILTITLINSAGEEISNSAVDLPIEELVKDGKYDEENKEIVLILEDGQEIHIPVGDLITGVVKSVDDTLPDNKGNVKIEAVRKTAVANQIYGTNGSGEQVTYKQNVYPKSDSVVIRDGNGDIHVNDATKDDTAASLKQVKKKLDANGLSTELEENYGMFDKTVTKIKIGPDTILNLSTDSDDRGYDTEQGWHITPNMINSQDSFSQTTANVVIASQPSQGGVLVNTTQGLPQEEVFMGTSLLGDGVHMDGGGTGKAREVNITREGVSYRDPEDKEVTTITWENMGKAVLGNFEISEDDNTFANYNNGSIILSSIPKNQSEISTHLQQQKDAIQLTPSSLKILSNVPTEIETEFDWSTIAKVVNAGSENSIISSEIDSTNYFYDTMGNRREGEFHNTISGTASTVGSKGFKITENNFHYACHGLFVFNPALQGWGIMPSTLTSIKKIVCERYGGSQELTSLGYIASEIFETIDETEQTNNYLTFLTEESPYLYSDDMYDFSKITFKDNNGQVLFTLESKNYTGGLIKWYGCVTQWTIIPSANIETYVEQQGNYYMPKEENIGAFYYVDIAKDAIGIDLVNEPACIKIDANYDSGTRQNYIDWGDDGSLTTAVADQCLKANYTKGDNYFTLTLKKYKRAGHGLEQAPIFKEISAVRFPDHPELGNAIAGLGFNTAFGDTEKSMFDFTLTSGYGNTAIGRYAVAMGARNTAVYAGVALGNHNIVLGQSGFAAGATNFISRSGNNGAALGSENVLNGKNNIAGGRANNVGGLYSVAFGYGNKVKGNNGIALGYNNNESDDLEFAVGLGNTLTGEGSMTLGRANQAYGNYNVCIGYGNITNNARYATAIGNVNHGYGNYSFVAGNNNTCYSDASGVIGINLKVNTSTDTGIYGNVGHFAAGSNNIIEGGRNVIIGGQSNTAMLHDSIMVGNNLKERTKGFGKAIFGNFNDDTSYASIVLGAGSSDTARRNVFEVYNDGAVKTPNARSFKEDGSDAKRLVTKEYVDSKAGLDTGNWAFSGNTLKNETNVGYIIIGNSEIGSITMNYSGFQYNKTGQTPKSMSWETLFEKLDKIE